MPLGNWHIKLPICSRVGLSSSVSTMTSQPSTQPTEVEFTGPDMPPEVQNSLQRRFTLEVEGTAQRFLDYSPPANFSPANIRVIWTGNNNIPLSLQLTDGEERFIIQARCCLTPLESSFSRIAAALSHEAGDVARIFSPLAIAFWFAWAQWAHRQFRDRDILSKRQHWRQLDRHDLQALTERMSKGWSNWYQREKKDNPERKYVFSRRSLERACSSS